MPDTIRITAIQCRQVPGLEATRANPFSDGFHIDGLHAQVDRGLAHFEDLYRQAAGAGCRLAAATEDFTQLGLAQTYLDDRAVFREAVARQTPLIAQRLSGLARTLCCHLVACYYALEGEVIHNVADLFSPTGGLAGRYRKVHLPLYETWQVTPGTAFPAFETDLGWIGMLICYDQMWPEAAACCALNGAQLIVHPSAAELPDYQMRTRARDCRVHYLSSTWQNSMIASPRGQILASAGTDECAMALAEVDLRDCNRPRPYYWESLYSGIDDHKARHLRLRHREAYAPLVDPDPPLGRQYPDAHLASTPEGIAAVYQVHREMQRRALRGEPIPYHWQW
ncbi:MAG: carbon-nitrogen hydrolase family protein [Candidatus Latescibacterota bacterium]